MHRARHEQRRTQGVQQGRRRALPLDDRQEQQRQRNVLSEVRVAPDGDPERRIAAVLERYLRSQALAPHPLLERHTDHGE